MKISGQRAVKFKRLKVIHLLKIDSVSLTYSIKRSGPSTEPWETPLRTIVVDDILLSMRMACDRLVMKNTIQDINFNRILRL